MKWNGERTKLQVTHVTGAAQSRLIYLVYLLTCYLTAEALEQVWNCPPSCFYIHPSMVATVAGSSSDAL